MYIDPTSNPGSAFSRKSPLDTLNHAEYDAAAYSIAQANGLISTEKVNAIMHSFFSGPHTRLPILGFYKFDTTLIHTMYLVLQRPYNSQRDMASLLYLRTKTLVGMSEASGIGSLQLLQAHIIIAYYELGHGLVSAAASSVGACAKKVRFMGLSPYAREYEDPRVTQERRRTWWGLFNLDRHIGLLCGDPLFTVPEPEDDHKYPCEDTRWLAGEIGPAPTVGSAGEAIFGQFARECQINHLAARVIRHVFDPAKDEHFQREEALQIERTLSFFLPLLERSDLAFGRYCASLSICASVTFIFYDRHNPHGPGSGKISDEALALMEPVAILIASYAEHCYAHDTDFDYETLSPYIMLSIYQAAVVCTDLNLHRTEWKYQSALLVLMRVLRNFGKRWAAAAYYEDLLESERRPLLPKW